MEGEQMTDVEALKRAVCDRVDALAPRLVHASRAIHANPETNYEERFAHQLLTDLLEELGVAPMRSAYGIETAFDAAAGTAGPTVAVLCEYDALPGVGHACGHNIIATAGLGAGLAAAFVAEQAGGRIRIMGTPAEEGGGGKVKMARAGAFDDVDAAMMVHPADADLITIDCIAIQELEVEYHGHAAHAAAAPWEGRNALDAAVLGYMNVAALRQHIRPNERIHGIFTKGGDKPNIVPADAAMDWYIRSGTLESLQPLKARVFTCLEAAATACGCTMDHAWVGETYADMIDNMPMVRSNCLGSGGVRQARGGQHRHGEHQLPGAVHPPDDQGGSRRSAHPQRGLRRVRRQFRRRSGRHRRRQSDGDDGDRPVDLGRTAATGPGRFRSPTPRRGGALSIPRPRGRCP
jgi:amidohydrolase